MRLSPLAVAQLGQVLDVHVHEAEIVVLERAALALALLRRRQAAQALGLEDAVDGIAVEMRQEVGDHEGEVIERKAGGPAQGTDDGPLLLRGLPGQLVRPAASGPGSPQRRACATCGRSRCSRRSAGPARPWARVERAISCADSWGGAGLGWMESITSSCGEELGAAGHQSAKRTPQSPNAPDPNNVPLPNT